MERFVAAKQDMLSSSSVKRASIRAREYFSGLTPLRASRFTPLSYIELVSIIMINAVGQVQFITINACPIGVTEVLNPFYV